MEFHNLFPTHVGVTKIEDATAINRELMADIREVRAATPNGKPDSWACNVYTTLQTDHDLHNRRSFTRLHRALTTKVNEFAAYLEVDTSRYVPRILECWLNVYGEGHSQDVHQHAGYELSGVYYIRTPPGCGRINFYSPLDEDGFSPIPGTRPSWKTQTIAHLEPQDGDLVLFRSWLRHSVSPNETAEERISIAFNVIFRAPGE